MKKFLIMIAAIVLIASTITISVTAIAAARLTPASLFDCSDSVKAVFIVFNDAEYFLGNFDITEEINTNNVFDLLGTGFYLPAKEVNLDSKRLNIIVEGNKYETLRKNGVNVVLWSVFEATEDGYVNHYEELFAEGEVATFPKAPEGYHYNQYSSACLIDNQAVDNCILLFKDSITVYVPVITGTFYANTTKTCAWYGNSNTIDFDGMSYMDITIKNGEGLTKELFTNKLAEWDPQYGSVRTMVIVTDENGNQIDFSDISVPVYLYDCTAKFTITVIAY